MKEWVRQAEIEILRYLLAHRDARDTIEGIAQWWLPQSGQYKIADVAAALHGLANRNLIRVWESTSAKAVYGLGSADPHSLEAYLQSLE